MSNEISLKWIMISIIAGLTTFVLIFTGYSAFLQDNYSTMNEDYISQYRNLSAYNDEFNRFSDGLSVTDVFELFTSGFLTAVNLGMGALMSLGNFLTGVNGIKGILSTLSNQFPEFAIVIGLFITIVSIYVVYRAMAEARGTSQQ